ncbi:MAG: DUF882 domain-containing protein [Desulfobacteraceae bacterium]|nr:MAG: DUF882 domain-containing protein [Desulfobacteraceae bacterium]
MPNISRRRFLITAAQAAAGLLVCPPLTGWAREPGKVPLTFFHTHTEECLRILHTPGRCSNSIQKKIKTFLRDFRTGDVHPIDPKLLDLLCKIQSVTGSRGTIEIISGYRSPQTNNRLRHNSSGVASKSLHMKGQAVDIRITDLPTWKLRNTAADLRAGGVGYYAKSDFVHLDTGRFRIW